MNAQPCLLVIGRLGDAFAPALCAAIRAESCVVEVPANADLRQLLHHVRFDSVLDATGGATLNLILDTDGELTTGKPTLKRLEH